MKLLLSMMRMIPKRFSDRMNPPMLSKDRLAAGSSHPSIRMNLTNMLICAAHCGTCPSFPGQKGDLLFCATGKSSAQVAENGCNCITCSLFTKCGSMNTGYFCVRGACSPDEREPESSAPNEDSYLSRFLGEERKSIEPVVVLPSQKTGDRPVDIELNFIGDKKVLSKSDIPLLQASLNAGIHHTHVCGGRALCSTCRVIVTEGLENCGPRNPDEAHLAKTKGFSPEIRLACQTKAHGNVSLRRLVLDERDISVAINEGMIDSGGVGRDARVAVMFSDIRSFTPFAENALAYDTFHILNRYFGMIGRHIDANGGYIDKYMGDGIMVIFGLDDNSKNNPSLSAVKTASLMLASLRDFNIYLKKTFNHEFKIGIGIHTGNVVIGQLGYRKKRQYTAIGDTVNTASRIESMNKEYGTSILVCEGTHTAVKDNFSWGRTFTAELKGKSMPMTIYEPVFPEA